MALPVLTLRALALRRRNRRREQDPQNINLDPIDALYSDQLLQELLEQTDFTLGAIAQRQLPLGDRPTGTPTERLVSRQLSAEQKVLNRKVQAENLRLIRQISAELNNQSLYAALTIRNRRSTIDVASSIPSLSRFARNQRRLNEILQRAADAARAASISDIQTIEDLELAIALGASLAAIAPLLTAAAPVPFGQLSRSQRIEQLGTATAIRRARAELGIKPDSDAAAALRAQELLIRRRYAEFRAARRNRQREDAQNPFISDELIEKLTLRDFDDFIAYPLLGYIRETLRQVTPKDTGRLSHSWSVTIENYGEDGLESWAEIYAPSRYLITSNREYYIQYVNWENWCGEVNQLHGWALRRALEYMTTESYNLTTNTGLRSADRSRFTRLNQPVREATQRLIRREFAEIRARVTTGTYIYNKQYAEQLRTTGRRV